MKLNLLPVCLLAILILSSCVGNKSAAPVPVPAGNFTGEFRRVHISKTGVHDTLKANIQLSLDLTTGFAVTGDTLTVHAGSHGGYAISANYIQFNDITYPKTGTPSKIHLNGAYEYYYDGSSVFQMVTSTLPDTLSFQYDLKKAN